MKRIILIITLMFLSVTAFVGNIGYAEANLSPWAKDAVEHLDELGLVQTLLKDKYGEAISRQEFVKAVIPVIEKMLDSELKNTEAQTRFKDTQDADVLKATSSGIIQGESAFLFNPKGPLTRQEASVIFARSMDFIEKKSGVELEEINQLDDVVSSFIDGDKIDDWAIDGISSAYNYGLISGIGSNMIDPLSGLTVEQALTMLSRMDKNYSGIIAQESPLFADDNKIIDKEEVTEESKEIEVPVEIEMAPIKVTFDNKGIEAAVRKVLKKESGQLTSKDFDKVTSIYMTGISDRNFEDLEKFDNLKYLTINYANLSNIEFVKKLPKLESLNVTFNNIEDLTPLKDLPNLIFFDGSNNNVKTVEPVLSLDHIEQFYLWENRGLKDLQRLNENPIMGIMGYSSLEFKAEFLKMIDERCKSFEIFLKDMPQDADVLSQFYYVYHNINSIEFRGEKPTDKTTPWQTRLSTLDLNVNEKSYAFQALLKYLKIDTRIVSVYPTSVTNGPSSSRKVTATILRINGENYYTTMANNYHLLSDSQMFQALTGEPEKDLPNLVDYIIPMPNGISSKDYCLNNYASMSPEATNFYKKDGDAYVFRSFDDATNMFDLNQVGQGKRIDDVYKSILSKNLSFDDAYNMYYFNETGIVKQNIKTQEKKILFEGSYQMVAAYKDRLFFTGYTPEFGVYTSDIEGNNKEDVFESNIYVAETLINGFKSYEYIYFVPYTGGEANGKKIQRVYNMLTGEQFDLSDKEIDFKIVNNYLVSWELGFTNFKVMKNDGSQVKALSGLKDGIPIKVSPIADRLFISQMGNPVPIEYKIADYMPEFIYFNDRETGGK